MSSAHPQTDALPLFARALLINPRRIERRLEKLQAQYPERKIPSLWQVFLGVLSMVHRLIFRSETVGLSADFPVRPTLRARLLQYRPIRVPALLWEGAITPWDLSGLASKADRVVTHLLGAHHERVQFVYDFQLLSTQPEKLRQVRDEARAIVNGSHPRAAWLRDLVVFERYHEDLLEAADAALEGRFELTEEEATNRDISLFPYLEWCATQPASPEETFRGWQNGTFSFAHEPVAVAQKARLVRRASAAFLRLTGYSLLAMADLLPPSAVSTKPASQESLQNIAGWIGEYSTHICTDPVDAARRLRPHLNQLLEESGRGDDAFNEQLRESEILRPLLAERYQPPAYDADDLMDFAPQTVGRAYGDFLKKYGLKHNYYGKLEQDTPHQYMVFRSISFHDYWHLASGYGADPLGEVGVIGFTIGNRLTHLGEVAPRLSLQLNLTIAGSMARYALHYPTLLAQWQANYARGLAEGQRAKSLDLVNWEEHWERPLKEVRGELGITPYREVP